MLRTWVMVLCAAAAPLFASGQKVLVIAGGIYEDRMALGVRTHFVPAPGVTVKFYRDGGDRKPTADDLAIGSAKSNADGVYTFRVDRPGDYWVAVDSRTFGPRGAWAEETFGPSGSLCAHPDGTTITTSFEGACFSGRTAAGSDDATSLTTSEHLALVTLADSSSTRVDFAFSFDAVTSVADGDGVQGSLRQFFLNANAVPGPNRMRFVPLTRAAEQRETTIGMPPRWWTITLASPLPVVGDGDTVIDGTAYNFLSPASVANVNPGRLGEPVTMRPEDARVPRIEKPDLEIVASGTDGIVCNAPCGLRGFAIHGTPNAIVLRADARMEHVLIGASPDAQPGVGGETGLAIERGTTNARHVLVTAQTRAGIAVAKGARLDAERLDVSRCGEPQSGAGIALFSDGSVVRSSIVTMNAGAGIAIGSNTNIATGNTIDGCTISGNDAGVVLAPGASRNVITRCDIMWNRLGGVAVLPFENATPPRENRLSANRFDENGLRPIVLDLAAHDPNELMQSTAKCDRIEGAPNGGISPPRVTSVQMSTDGSIGRVVIRGNACPGEIVELYQSFVTSGVREEKQSDLPRIREEERAQHETLTTKERTMALPSIGEFNYLGATNTAPDGTFEAAFPLPLVTETDRPVTLEETNIWAQDVLAGAKPADRAFSALAIDAAGNTSEMSVRRKVD